MKPITHTTTNVRMYFCRKSEKLNGGERLHTHVFADIILAVSVAVQFSLLLCLHSLQLSQPVLQLLQLVIQTQDLRLLLATLSFHAVSLQRQPVTHNVNIYYYSPTTTERTTSSIYSHRAAKQNYDTHTHTHTHLYMISPFTRCHCVTIL